MIESSWLSFSSTPASILFGVIVIAATAAVSWVSLRRDRFRRLSVVLEALRLLLVCLLVATMLQPEWMQKFKPESQPVVAILADESNSMLTQDVWDRSSSNAQAESRDEWIRSTLASDIWASLENNVEVIRQPFSSSASDPKSLTDINQALAEVMERNSNLRGVVLMSDGSWNAGNAPTEAATQMRMKGIPVFGVVVGSDRAMPDLEVDSLSAPTHGVVGKSIRIPYSISSTMPKATNVTVSLEATGGEQFNQSIEIPANGSFSDAFNWKPKKTGSYKLKLDLPVADGESIDSNNVAEASIEVREESIKVLVVESFPRWEYRYLRNALVRDPGVDVQTIMFHPQIKRVGDGIGYLANFPSKEQLSQYDVVFLGDVGIGPDQLSAEDCKNIRGVVESQASGLILMPGIRGYQQSLVSTELEPLIPVQFDEVQKRGWGSPTPSQMLLTGAGEESLLTKLADRPEDNAAVWRSLPGFQWYAAVRRAKAGTQTLAVHASDASESGRIPLIVTKTFGSGKVLFMGIDGAWRWRKGVEDKYHYRFWAQVARWMAYQRNMAGGKTMRLFYTPDHPKTGSTVTLNANVADATGEPLSNGQVSVQVVSPSGQTQLIRLTKPSNTESESEWGLFTADFTSEEIGKHELTMTCRENGETLETTIDVQGSNREKIGKPVNQIAMQEIATLTHGQLVSTDRVSGILDAIQGLPEPEPRIKRIRFWANPFWGSFILFLLGLFWVGRKVNGTV